MQCRSFKELAMDDRFPEACEIRSVVRVPTESHEWSGVEQNWPLGDRCFCRYSTVTVRFLEKSSAPELHRNRYCWATGARKNVVENIDSTRFPNISNNRFLLTFRFLLLTFHYSHSEFSAGSTENNLKCKPNFHRRNFFQFSKETRIKCSLRNARKALSL